MDVQDRQHAVVGHMILYRLDNVTSVLNLSHLRAVPDFHRKVRYRIILHDVAIQKRDRE